MRRLRLTFCIAAMVALFGCPRVVTRACSPPRSYWRTPQDFPNGAPHLDVSLDRSDRLYLGGQPTSAMELSRYLGLLRGGPPRPEILLQAEMGVSCGALESVRDRMDAALDCRNFGSKCAEGMTVTPRIAPAASGALSS